MPTFFKKWLVTFRLFSISATAIPCLGVLAYGLRQRGWHSFPLRTISSFIGVILLQIAINVLNDVEDDRRQIDLPGNFGGSGAIQKGWVTPNQLRKLGILSFLLAGVCAIPSLVAEPKLLSVPVLVAALGVLGYSGRPLSLKYRALGDVAVFFLCGPLLTLAYSVASFGVYNSEVLWMGAGFGFAAVAILHANNLQDIPDDTLRGAQTLASKLGFELARFGVAFFYVCSLASFLILCEASERWLPILFSLCALPLMIKLSRKSIQALGPRSPLLHLTRIEAANIHLALGILVSLGLLANP